MTEVKEATLHDIEIIQDIANKSWFATYSGINSDEQNNYMFLKWYSRESLENQILNGQSFWILHHNNKAVAYASISRANDTQFKLHKIYLLPELQGQGLGKKLLGFIEEIVKIKGASELLLNVNRHNKAVFFYKRLGYEILREEDIAFDQYWMNDYLMGKEL